jgi:uncharacterized delta-60 repeat protein
MVAVVVVGCAAVLALAGSAAGAAGDLDPTFGAGGVVETPALGIGGSEANDLIVLPGGDMVAAGFLVTAFTLDPFTINIDFALVRYDTNGIPDAAFGAAGAAQAEFAGGNDQAEAVARQPDGKLVAAGWAATDSTSSDIEFAIARFNADGTLDSTFSGDGKATTNFTSSADFGYDVAIDAAGRILVVGTAGLDSFGGTVGDFALARYNPDGTPDVTFGPDGKKVIDFAGSPSSQDIAYGVAVQSDGKTVVAGTAGRDTAGSTHVRDFALTRLNADGSLDTGFGSSGRATTEFPLKGSDISSVALAADGKIIAAGRAGGGANADFALARYLPNGVLDSAFDGDGTTTVDFFGGGDEANDVVIDPLEGKIVAAGFAQPDSALRFALARFNTDGSLDTGFGTSGKVVTQIGTVALNHTQGRAVAMQDDGKIVLAGATQSVRFGLARYLASGVPDTTPPQMIVPATGVANATSPTGATVFFNVVAVDDVDGELPTSCVPEPGSEFPIGDTEVTCEATDAAGNSASVSFVVHVKGAPEQIADLTGSLAVAVGGAAVPRPISEALERAALQAIGKRPSLACQPLSLVAAWIRVEIQLGQIKLAEGEALVDDIARIRDVIGC